MGSRGNRVWVEKWSKHFQVELVAHFAIISDKNYFPQNTPKRVYFQKLFSLGGLNKGRP